MRFGWLTLSLSPSPQEDAARIDQLIEQVCDMPTHCKIALRVEIVEAARGKGRETL